MNKQVLTLGIILSLGSMGCAGLGVQHNSSLTAQIRSEQGVDGLWFVKQEPAGQGLEPPRYADQDLGDLWNGTESPGASAPSRAPRQWGGLGDLWNPSSVTRSWEGEAPRDNRKSPSDTLFSSRRAGRKVASQ